MNQLRPGQRYLFHEKAPYHETNIMFRANVFAVYENSKTLVVNHFETEKSPRTLVSIPFEWIVKTQTLENIVEKNPILPSEILLIIDGYL
jgi:hypothetical protein